MDVKGYEIILASGSPRRKAFFEQLGIPFTQKVIPVEEVYPESLSGQAIVEYLVKLKAEPFKSTLQEKQIVITADTIVWHQNQCLGKPKNTAEATQMLNALSDTSHQVMTAVGFLQKNSWDSICCTSEVNFSKLNPEAIAAYVATASPLDKAGAYGIQDAFGMHYIHSIQGSYTNIIGLPVAQLVEKLEEIITN
ncbi:MAG: Maf family nucleotide pyrophosphatase [Flavobacteriaceae bacterium]|jgi:septum formation protein